LVIVQNAFVKGSSDSPDEKRGLVNGSHDSGFNGLHVVIHRE
jgi:hypothetical protein